MEAPKELKGSLIGDLFPHFASPSEVTTLSDKLAAGGYGWGHAKQDLFEVMNEHLKEARDRYFELRKDEGKLNSILAEGREKARAIAAPILTKVRQAQGFL